MRVARPLGAAILLSAMSSASVFAQAKEPSAKDIYEAYAAYWLDVSAKLKRTGEGCKSGAIKGAECIGPATAGITQVEVRAVDKHRCNVAPSGDGHNCTFTPEVRVSGTNDLMTRSLESSLNGPKTNLFRRISGKWEVFQRTDQ